MAEMFPPNADVHPMRVLFMIPKINPPTLKNADLWSAKFRDFISKCLVKETKDRYSSEDLLNVYFYFLIFY